MTVRGLGLSIGFLAGFAIAATDTVYVQNPLQNAQKDTIYVIQQTTNNTTVAKNEALTKDNSNIFIYVYPIALIGFSGYGATVYTTVEIPIANATSITFTPSIIAWDFSDADFNRFGLVGALRKYTNEKNLHRGFFVEGAGGFYRGSIASDDDSDKATFTTLDLCGYIGTVAKWEHFALSFDLGIGVSYWNWSFSTDYDEDEDIEDFDGASFTADIGFSLGFGL
jgi:hypothetical protein